VPALLRACRRRSWERLRAAVEAGEEHACGVLADTATSVGRALAAACTTVNPERIVLGGEVAALGPVFFDRVQAVFETYSTSLVHRGIRLTPAALDDRSGAMGGLALVLQETPLLAGYTESMPAVGDGCGTSGADDVSESGRSI
jgi:predicted NBD/HSP70 family sugar kinase